MKTLYLLRHAKSSWDDESLPDNERPLNKRGKNDAPKMGKWLQANLKPPQLILCSDSARTRATIEPVMEAWQLPAEVLRFESSLYHASTETLWDLVQSCDNKIDRLMLVGHNPGLTEFANSLCKEFETENIPTSGFAAFSFDIKSWEEAEANEAQFETYQFPKNL
ncbi:phosphohistidine phosphatase, sixa [Flammeovirgaceae bacterium 311]|nr:phosphohistidine phosphatase, sixa [Flammeovirgaceae bacterium 311]